jgi:hypothetical protein
MSRKIGTDGVALVVRVGRVTRQDPRDPMTTLGEARGEGSTNAQTVVDDHDDAVGVQAAAGDRRAGWNRSEREPSDRGNGSDAARRRYSR